MLLALTFTSVIVASAGPSAGLLLTTGHERFYAKAISFALVARIALIAVLAPWHGALGVALGVAAANIPLSVFLAWSCRARCGVDPSILGVVRGGAGSTARAQAV